MRYHKDIKFKPKSNYYNKDCFKKLNLYNNTLACCNDDNNGVYSSPVGKVSSLTE